LLQDNNGVIDEEEFKQVGRFAAHAAASSILCTHSSMGWQQLDGGMPSTADYCVRIVPYTLASAVVAVRHTAIARHIHCRRVHESVLAVWT
jgi:hypothetical protein